MWITIRTGLLTLVGFVIASAASSEQLVYSHQFDQGIGYPLGSLQYDDWLSYRESLPESGVMSITVSGSRDPVGRTCSDPVKAQQIADAMFAGVVGQPGGTITLNVSCDGLHWNVGSCIVSTGSNGVELNVGPVLTMCGCNTDQHTVRPGIGGEAGSNWNWGGIAGGNCAASTQNMTVTVNTVGDSDADGVSDGDDLCPDTAPDDPVGDAGCSDAQVDMDADGVLGGDDLCPDTAPGVPVDAGGCSEAQVESGADDGHKDKKHKKKNKKKKKHKKKHKNGHDHGRGHERR
jgi:hypothetical protein